MKKDEALESANRAEKIVDDFRNGQWLDQADHHDFQEPMTALLGALDELIGAVRALG